MAKILIMRNIISIFILLFSACGVLCAQDIKISWQRVAMDESYETDKLYRLDTIIAEHQEQMGDMMEVIIFAEDEIEKGQPESALSNIATDFLLDAAEPFINNGYPTLSLTNFGGIRSNFPKGAVRIYEIYSTFPFDNSVVVAQIKGRYIRQMIERFASREKFEALGGVSIVVENKELMKCEIEGQPLDDDKTYNLVTIDFLLDGGDRFNIADDAESIIRTGIMMRDAAIQYLRKLSRQGIVLRNEKDGRIIIK